MLWCQEVRLCQVQIRNLYFSRGLWLISFYQAIGRQWKQWCSDHKEAKSPTDVVSSYCRTALNFTDFLHISKAFQLTLTAKCSFHFGLIENLQVAESNCSFTFKLSVLSVDAFQTSISIYMLLLFVVESDRVCFGRERPTDANEQTAWREHGTLNSRSVELFSH